MAGGDPGALIALLVLGLLLPGALECASAQPSSRDSSRVQVRLHHKTSVESFQLTPNQGDLIVRLPGGGTPLLRLQRGDTVRLGRRQQDIYVRRGDEGLYAHSLLLSPSSESTWTLGLDTEASRTYSGDLILTHQSSGTDLRLINRVPLHDYVASVVASEYGLDDREGAKAMAVVARTYALFSHKQFEGDYDHVDGTASQVYEGVDAITEASRRAARQTRGQIVTFDGDPIQAVYFSSSGGHTANNEDVWTDSDPLPYLRGKEDPYDRVSPHHRWSARVERNALLQALTLHQNTSVSGFLLGDRTADGRLATIELLLSNDSNVEIEAATFRTIVNDAVEGNPLKSTWFDARREGSEYVFEGRGYGHGVGLSQWGAHAMAEQGKSYREILSFYYTGVQIEQLEGPQAAPLRPSVANESPPVAPDSTAQDSTTRRIGW